MIKTKYYLFRNTILANIFLQQPLGFQYRNLISYSNNALNRSIDIWKHRPVQVSRAVARRVDNPFYRGSKRTKVGQERTSLCTFIRLGWCLVAYVGCLVLFIRHWLYDKPYAGGTSCEASFTLLDIVRWQTRPDFT